MYNLKGSVNVVIDILGYYAGFSTRSSRSVQPSVADGSPFFDNLLAAIAEKLADDIGIKRPQWTRRWAPLRVTWESQGTPRMRAANAARTPVQFKERGIIIPKSAIWRDREPVPA